jgi:hypothetical protein
LSSATASLRHLVALKVMPTGTPLPNAKQVFEEIGMVLRPLGHYLSPNDWNIKRLARMAEQLVHAAPADGYSALACIIQLTGDSKKAISHIDNAIRLAGDKMFYLSTKVGILCNLGFFSEALDVYRQSAAPERGNMTAAWHRGYLCGAFKTMSSFIPRAKKMQLDLGGLDVDTAVRAANVMEKAGIADEDVARVFDAAGHVLRAHRLFFVGDGLRVKVFDAEDHDAFIEATFDLEASLKDVHQLYQEFVDQVIETILNVPAGLTVSFRPWKQQNERNAA